MRTRNTWRPWPIWCWSFTHALSRRTWKGNIKRVSWSTTTLIQKRSVNILSGVLKVLSKIINLTWRQTNNDVIKISRWIRCLFQLSLTFDEAISLKCLDQASQIAAARLGVSLSPCPSPLLQQISLPISPPASSSPVKVEIADEGSKESDKDHYPTTELEWLAATSFNHAVDYYLQENDAQCKVWAETALNVAQWVEDGGALKGLLMEKYSGLVWSE